jgi:hypothetical protein
MAMALVTQHRNARCHHHQREEEQQILARHQFSQSRAYACADCACRAKDDGGWPMNIACTPMTQKIDKRVDGNSERAGADGAMRVLHPDNVKQKRHRQDGAPATYDPEREPDAQSGGERPKRLQRNQRDAWDAAFCASLIGWNGPN